MMRSLPGRGIPSDGGGSHSSAGSRGILNHAGGNRIMRALRTKRGLAGWAVAACALFAGTFFWRPVGAVWHCFRAQHYLDLRQDERALGELEAAIRLAPEDAEACFLLARTHRRLKNADLARDLFERAAGRGDDPERTRREMYLLEAQLGNMRVAEPHLAELLEDRRGDGPDIFEAYVLGYILNMRFDRAEPLARAWRRDYPEDAHACFLSGYIYHSLGRMEEAVEVYRKGLELLPSRTVARREFAVLLAQMRRWDEAEAQFQRCAEEAPNDTTILCDQAAFYVMKNESGRARELLQRILAKAPDDFYALELLGRVDVMEGRNEEAVRSLLAASRQRPYDKDTRYALGTALQRLGRTAEAKPHLDYFAEANRAEDEIARKTRASARHPEDIELRCEIGRLLMKYGDPTKAAQWWQSVLQIKPDHQEASRALAAYHEGRGDFQAAVPVGKEFGPKKP
jgi:predicted Zn-dependent protease